MNQLELLTTLLRKQRPMRFQEIWKAAGESNRNTLNTLIDEQISEGYIETSPKDWQRGQKKFFSLTSKGETAAKHLVSCKAKASLETLEKISYLSASDPSKFESYINNEMEKIERTTVRSKNMSFQEAIEAYTRRETALKMPIKDLCRSVHKIHSATLGNGNSDGSVTIISGDTALLIDKERFEDLNFELLLFMPLSAALKEKF